MKVFLTKFSDKFFYRKEHEQKIYADNNFDTNDFVISKNHITQNSLGIFSQYSFITGDMFNDSKFWEKYSLDKDIFKKIEKIKFYQKQNHYGFIPNELLNEFAKEYLKLIEQVYVEYINGKNYTFNRSALLNFEKINSILYMLSEHNPFLILKYNLENYKQYIYEIDNFSFLKVNYSMNTTNGLIVSYDRSINNIAKDDPIRECMVSRFGKKGKILLADYNAFQPRILFSIAGYDVKTNKDFYNEISESLEVKEDRNKVKLNIFKILYGDYNNNTNFDKIEKLKSRIYNEYIDNKNYITSITGRRKFVEMENLSNKLVNTFVQLAQSDIIIEFLIKISNYLKNKRTKLISFISDCFMFDVYDTEREELLDFLKNNLQKSIYTNCFFKLNIKEGKSWAEC